MDRSNTCPAHAGQSAVEGVALALYVRANRCWGRTALIVRGRDRRLAAVTNRTNLADVLPQLVLIQGTSGSATGSPTNSERITFHFLLIRRPMADRDSKRGQQRGGSETGP